MQKSKGLTLIELLCALAITALLAHIATPNLTRLIRSTQANAIYYQLFTTIQYVRGKAVFSNEDVLLCPSSNNINCINDWTLPLVVFVDKNKNRQRDADETIDRVLSPLKQGDQLLWKASGTSRYLRFIADGSTGAQNGSFYICPTHFDQTSIKRIVIYRSGRARRARKDEIKLSHCQ